MSSDPSAIYSVVAFLVMCVAILCLALVVVYITEGPGALRHHISRIARPRLLAAVFAAFLLASFPVGDRGGDFVWYLEKYALYLPIAGMAAIWLLWTKRKRVSTDNQRAQGWRQLSPAVRWGTWFLAGACVAWLVVLGTVFSRWQ